jgi:cyanophycinase
MKPKGKLLIIGGAEEKGEADDKKGILGSERFEILKELLPPNKRHKIEIVTTASDFHREMKKSYTTAFKKMGYNSPGFISIKNKIEAREKTYSDRISKATAVFFTGGDQFKISTILGGTYFAEILLQKFNSDKNFIVGGTSAGAMVMSQVMIAEAPTEEVLINHKVTTTAGLGLLNNCIIDTHFIKRGRFGRLAHAVIINPQQLGIGLGEDTALIIKNGEEAECRGSGMVVIIDGNYVEQTNITEAKDDTPIFVENLKINLLVRGCRFSIKTRKLHTPAIDPRGKFAS